MINGITVQDINNPSALKNIHSTPPQKIGIIHTLPKVVYTLPFHARTKLEVGL